MVRDAGRRAATNPVADGAIASLLVASLGGHLKELHRLRPRLEPLVGEVVWVTFESEQSRSMLAGERVFYLPNIEPRDYVSVLRALRPALHALRQDEVASVVSTGSGIALAVLPQARLLGIPCHYIESATRCVATSLTGSVLSRVPGVHLYSQWPTRVPRGWSYRGSVFDGFQPAPARSPGVIRKVVVMLGTMRTYSFRALLERLLRILPPDVDALWQVGCTDSGGLPGRTASLLPACDLDAALRDADVIVAHAGIGSALSAFEAGKCPVLVPRRVEFGENVDEHQHEIARELAARGLAVSRSVDDLCLEDLVEASTIPVRTHAYAPAFVLAG